MARTPRWFPDGQRLLVWGNLVWWLPELRRRELPKPDTVVRAA